MATGFSPRTLPGLNDLEAENKKREIEAARSGLQAEEDRLMGEDYYRSSHDLGVGGGLIAGKPSRGDNGGLFGWLTKCCAPTWSTDEVVVTR